MQATHLLAWCRGNGLDLVLLGLLGFAIALLLTLWHLMLLEIDLTETDEIR
jgi:hypothetical protein